MNKTQQRRILKDLRRQIRWAEKAITEGDQNWIDIYSNQLSASAMMLHSENYGEGQK